MCMCLPLFPLMFWRHKMQLCDSELFKRVSCLEYLLVIQENAISWILPCMFHVRTRFSYCYLGCTLLTHDHSTRPLDQMDGQVKLMIHRISHSRSLLDFTKLPRTNKWLLFFTSFSSAARKAHFPPPWEAVNSLRRTPLVLLLYQSGLLSQFM